MVGVSVGLGNVWRFPYMMGKFGGSAFLFIYLLFTICFAIPALSAELALGRESRKGPIGAFSHAFGSRLGMIIGYLLMIVVIVADSYYLVVIANVFTAMWFSVGNGFSMETIPAFNDLLGNGWLQYLTSAGLLVVSLWIIHLGLQKGIEKVSRVIIPFFLVVVLILIGYVTTIEGAYENMVRFIQPDLSVIDSSVVFAALGQAFFSLGLGGTFLLMYGSYLDDRQSIIRSSITTALGDCSASVLASLFLIPVILVYGLDMTSGPSLIFNTLPRLFSDMPWGRIVGSLFLLALVLVAFLSNIAALEVLASGIQDDERVKISKTGAIYIIGAVELGLISISAFDPGMIGHLDLIFGSGMQTLGSVITVIGLTWGLGKAITSRQIFGKESKWSKFYFFWLKWIIPAVLLLILVLYVYS
jgi:NSS family neurotransmitter:Na+ symporter